MILTVATSCTRAVRKHEVCPTSARVVTAPAISGNGSTPSCAGSTITGVPPPGWYPDPWRLAPERWWDGSAWTSHIAPAPAPANPTGSWPAAGGLPPPGFAGPGALRARHGAMSRSARLARWAVLAWVLGMAVNAASLSISLDAFRTAFNAYDPSNPAAQSFGLSTSPAATVLVLVSYLLLGFGAVGFLIWQYRAAQLARVLGLPAALSPGLGVGGWFIPVVNLWFPYQSLRDCLPPGVARSHHALAVWLAYFGAGLTSSVAVVVGLVSGPVALAVGIVPVALTVLVAVSARRLIALVVTEQAALVQRADP